MSDNKPVSTIIPAYNASETIERAVKSALNQTYEPVEVIVVDDKSMDDTVEIVRNLKADVDNLRLIEREERGHPARARNDAISQAHGQYMAFLDADDRWKESKLSKQIEVMEDAGEKVSISDMDNYGFNGEYLGEERKSVEGSREEIIRRIYLGELTPFTPTLVVHRDVINEVGMFNPELERMQDTYFLMEAVGKFGLCHVPECLAERYKVRTGWSASPDRDQEHFAKQYEIFNKLAQEKFPFLESVESEFMTQLYFYNTDLLDEKPELTKKIDPSHLGFLGRIKYHLYFFQLGFIWRFVRNLIRS